MITKRSITYKLIGDQLIIINGLLSTNNIDNIYEYISKSNFFRKEDFLYKCSVKKLSKTDYLFLNSNIKFNVLEKIVSNIYGKKLYLTPVGEIVKMCNGDYLSNHTDSFHKIQGVIYLTNVNNIDGGEFIYLNKYKIIPKAGDIVFFNGKNMHQVLKIKSKGCRYSITFGFN